jgi:predicted dehydrogenase
MQRKSIDRREFLESSSAAAVAMTLPRTVPQTKRHSANDRMKVAFIAAGGRGARNLKTMADTGLIDVVAVCDVDSTALKRAAHSHSTAKQFFDFRKLYDSIGNDIDAVVVSTPEHIHAFATMPALQLGKHVYCEKPLTYNIDETRKITQAAAKAGVVTQMGTQIHAAPNYHRVVELIQSGAIGPVSEAHVWVSRAWGLKSKEELAEDNKGFYVDERPTESMTPPDYLKWDLWLGPAPERPYHKIYFPGPNWYRWWDFGNGTMSDLGSHWNDLPYWALKLDAPQTVESCGVTPQPQKSPASMTAIYK